MKKINTVAYLTQPINNIIKSVLNFKDDNEKMKLVMECVSILDGSIGFDKRINLVIPF